MLGSAPTLGPRKKSGAHALHLNCVSGDGPFDRALGEFIDQHGSRTFVDDRHTRALWLPRADAETYFQAALSRSGRQDLRRKRKRLAESGRLELRVLEHAGDVARWTQDFLELEKSGWKGLAGTALAANPVERQYFEDIVAAGFERGQVQMLGLFLDNKPIALKCNFLSGGGAYVFKPAYDEAYARFSPGALLELDNIKLCYGGKPVRWMDSCAASDAPMWNRLWLDRRPIQSLLISSGSFWGNVFVASLRLMKKASTFIKRVIRKFQRSTPGGTP